ncbi:Zn-dependent protease (includes SpoIVFB) [Sanguibacter gelidistatuariae]|uniref:Zn-dependent protease (Includes SpoIVFB) n=1 Tax=Sanguibacter gelidistatuariae TaxID=1814289 RepID=A0A1G6TEP9_9MICO|nr:Zn-dependent protease (includes SpoIVFB) [Sanguibacter gelidistatuariae]
MKLQPSALIMVVVLTILFVPTVRSMNPALGSQAIAGSLVLVVMLMVSVFLHEVAHALAAKSQGMTVHELALTFWGGHTAYSDAHTTPLNAAFIAVVGPLTNLILAAAAWFGYQSQPATSSLALMLYVSAFANAAVAVFNLLPGLPLDGGQIAESVVWALTGSRLRGTVAAAWSGRILAVGLVVAAIAVPTLRGEQVQLLMVVWAGLIGSFMWSAATGALAQSRTRARIEALDPRRLAAPAVAVDVETTVAQVREITRSTQLGGIPAQVVLVDHAQAVGYVDDAALAAVPDDAAAATQAWSVMVALPPGSVVDGGLRGAAFHAAAVQASRRSPVFVVVDSGRVVGLLRAADVARAVHLD